MRVIAALHNVYPVTANMISVIVNIRYKEQYEHIHSKVQSLLDSPLVHSPSELQSLLVHGKDEVKGAWALCKSDVHLLSRPSTSSKRLVYSIAKQIC